MNIINACLHQIDVTNNQCKEIIIDSQNEDLVLYLQTLLAEVDKKKQKKYFSFASHTTEFYLQLAQACSTSTLEKSGTALAERLLIKEQSSEERMAHLSSSGEGHLNKGSFLQFIYEESGEQKYLGVKVDHQEFLDEDDFKKHLGLAFSKKVYKACKVDFADGAPCTTFVCDTNSKIAKYWWHDFLELKEVNTDARNTELACSKVITALAPLKKESLVDYTNLRNAVITGFRQEDTTMMYFDFIEKSIESYSLIDTNATTKMSKIIERLKTLPEKHGFDTQFQLIPSAVKKRRTKYQLRDDVELVLKDGILDLDDKIWWTKLSDGKEVVVIHSPEGHDSFEYKELS